MEKSDTDTGPLPPKGEGYEMARRGWIVACDDCDWQDDAFMKSDADRKGREHRRDHHGPHFPHCRIDGNGVIHELT